jgi:hypothetical protein
LLWARSAVPSSIPVSSTTMMIEAHWSRIKRRYLVNNPRARLDLVVHIIMNDYCPSLLHKWQQCLIDRRDLFDFERALLTKWNKTPEIIRLNGINPSTYLTDVNRWVCSCPSFLTSRFLICKHLF